MWGLRTHHWFDSLRAAAGGGFIYVFIYFVLKKTSAKNKREQTRLLTVGRHAHRNALLESTFLALVPRHSVDNAFPLVLTSVGGVQVLLDGPPEETLGADERRRSEETKKRKRGESTRAGRAAAAFTLQPSHVMQR